MRDVVLVDPSNGRAGLHGGALRSEGKVVDFHLRVRSLHWGGRKGGRRGEDGGRKHSRDPDVTYDFCHGSGFAASALQWLIDDRKPLLAAPEGDVGDAEKRAQLIVRDFQWAGRRRRARRRLREGSRHGRVKGDVTLDLCMIWWMWPLSTVTDPKRLR